MHWLSSEAFYRVEGRGQVLDYLGVDNIDVGTLITNGVVLGHDDGGSLHIYDVKSQAGLCN